MALRIQTASGVLSNTAIWSDGDTLGIPGDGDRIVNYNGFDLTIDQNATIGANVQSANWLSSFGSWNAPADSAISAAIWVRGGKLIVNDNVTLTLKGDLISSNSEVIVGAGVTINIDASGAEIPAGYADVDANKFYVIDIALQWGGSNHKGRITFNGEQTNKSKIECIGGASLFLAGDTVVGGPQNSSGCVDAKWTHFKNFGASPVEMGTYNEYVGGGGFTKSRMWEKNFSYYQITRAWTPLLSAVVSNTVHAEDIRFKMVDCILEDTTGVKCPYALTDGGSRAQVTFDRCIAKASKYWMGNHAGGGANYSFIDIQFTTDVSEAATAAAHKISADVAPFRKMLNCSWDRRIEWLDSGAGWEIENNVFAQGLGILSNNWFGYGPISFKDNTVIRSSAFGLSSSDNDYKRPDSWTANNYAGHYGFGDIASANIDFQEIPYGTGKRDPSIPAEVIAAAGSMGIGSYIKNNYFIEDHDRPNPHVLSLAGGNGDGAHIIMDNIFEVVDSDGQGESVYPSLVFSVARTTPTKETGGIFYCGNINLPSANQTSAGTFWLGQPHAGGYPSDAPAYDVVSLRGQDVMASTYLDATSQRGGTGKWFYGHMPHMFTNNTCFTGITEGAINVSEHGYAYDDLRYVKNNIFWDNTVRSNPVWAIGDVSNRKHPDLVLPENVNNNIKINLAFSANPSTDYSFTNEVRLPNTSYAFYNGNGYRGLDLSNPDEDFTYTPLGGSEQTIRRLNAFGINDVEISISDPALIPFGNHVTGSSRYNSVFTGTASASAAWQSYSKEFDWSATGNNNGMTRAGLRAFIRECMSPVYSTADFNSQLEVVNATPTNYYDSQMVENGNPLGNHGSSPYTAASPHNLVLIALNNVYKSAGAYIGALPFAAPNRIPVPGIDYVAVTKNESVTISYAALLGNDIDPDGGALTIASFSSPTIGTAVANSSAQELTYTPPVDQVGSDSFTYTVNDSLGKSGIGTVNLAITSEAPIALSHTNPNGVGNAFLTITKASLLAGATDADGNDANITFNGFSARSAQATSDNIQAVGDDAIGYQAPTGVTGVDSFTYTVIDDNGDIGQGTYTIVLAAVVGGGGGGAPIGDPKAVVYIELQKEEATSDPFTLQPSQALELFVSPRLRANEFVRLEIKGSEQKWCTLGTIINEDDTSGVTINGSRVPREYRVIKSVTQLTTRVESN